MSLFPIICPACRVRQGAPCVPCAGLVKSAPTVPTPPGLTSVVAGFAYDDAGAELLRGFKFGNQRALWRWFGDCVAAAVADATTDQGAFDFVCWVPASRSGHRQRGYDQSEQVARRVAQLLGVRCSPGLKRQSGGRQTGSDRATRLRGPLLSVHGAVERRLRAESGVSVLLIDDVMTTGASLRAGAHAFHEATLPGQTPEVMGAVVSFNAGATARLQSPHEGQHQRKKSRTQPPS